MGNCLVTKLKGVVQNDNLPKLDELVINGLGGGFRVQLYNIQGCTISSSDTTFTVTAPAGVVIENVSSYIVPANDTADTIINTTNDGKLKVSNKYTIRTLLLSNCFAEGIKYLSVVYLTMMGARLTYEINDYINPNILYSFMNYARNAKGSLTDLGSCVNIGAITTGTETYDGEMRSIIDGDWLDFVVVQVRHERTTGTITGAWSATLFNGYRLSNDANYRLSWSPSGDNYLVTYISGESLDNPTTSKSATIDANGNVIS